MQGLRLAEHSGEFVRYLGGWAKYHRWLKDTAVSRAKIKREQVAALLKMNKNYFDGNKIGRNEACPYCLDQGKHIKWKKCKEHNQ